MGNDLRIEKPLSGADRAEAGRKLLEWYDKNRRSLPWREDPSPYHVWISEIMLQQTRVEAVKGYYRRFLDSLPDVRTLAEADEDTCLKLWEGLGYYSRARNLRLAAQEIVSRYEGRMPGTSAELKKLPGIGAYTAAAVASIAFGEKVPAIDGNLLRIFSRLTLYEEDVRKPAAMRSAERFYLEMMPEDRPGDFNQALMDLGAGICTPREGPVCLDDPSSCPLRPFCLAFAAGRSRSLPVLPVKKERRKEKRTILVIQSENRILLRKRPPKGLLAGMWEFPNEEGWLTADEALRKALSYSSSCGLEPLRITVLPESRHIFTHREWLMHGFLITAGSFPEPLAADWKSGAKKQTTLMAEVSDLQNKYAIPSAYSVYLASLNSLDYKGASEAKEVH